MKAVFYKNSSDNLIVNKKLVELFTLDNVLWKEETSAFTPSITFRKMEDFKKANYVKLRILGADKYFYIQEMILHTGGIIEVKLKCDVLMSYASYIKGLKTIVTRQEHKTNHKYIDNNIHLSSERIIDTVSLGNVGSDNASIILTVVN